MRPVRFVLALIAFCAAACLIALGVAQRTVLLPEDRTSVTAAVAKDVHYVVIPGTALNSRSGQQRISVRGTGTVFAAYGRTTDVTAWLSGERYQQLGVGADGRSITGSTVRRAPAVAGLQGGALTDPNGSDLWVEQRRTSRSLDWSVRVPKDVSVLVASDGRSAAPGAVTVTWPVRVSTPFATPLIIGGAVLAVVGLFLYILALVDMKRRRGPRRAPPPRPPKPPAPSRPRERAPASSGRSDRPSRSPVARMTAAVIAAVVIPLAAGQSTAFAASPAPTPPTTAKRPSSLYEDQAVRIISEAAAVAADADRTLDKRLLGTRYTGPALALRSAAYTVHRKDEKAKLPSAIPVRPGDQRLILPEATTTWPRTLFAVVTGDAAKRAPLALGLVQTTPRDAYRVLYQMDLEPGATVPSMPAASDGGQRLAADAPLLKSTPEHIADDYGLLLRKSSPEAASRFDLAKDDLLKVVGAKAKKRIAKSLGGTAKISFSDSAPDPDSILAIATAKGDAIAAVNLSEQWKVEPSKDQVKVRPSGSTKILSKVSSTTKGVRSTYGYQLLFFVPGASSSEPIQLLGYAQGLVSAKEL